MGRNRFNRKDNSMESVINLEVNDICQEALVIKHQKISDRETPQAYVSQKQGFDYVDEGYMRKLLNDFFPVWSWDIIKYEMLGDKVIVVHGRLSIFDEGVGRHYDAIASHRIAVSQRTGEYVDISNDLKSANTDAFKVAVNRLCNIADDVYRKQIKDLSLSEEQEKNIYGLLDGMDIDVITQVKKGVDSMAINSSNYDATIKRINKLKDKK